jgi:hypothetical protein
MGTAVLTTKNVGLSDYLMKNDFGWVSELHVDDLYSKLMLAYENPSRRQEIRRESPIAVRQDFADSKLAVDYLNMYDMILNVHHNK